MCWGWITEQRLGGSCSSFHGWWGESNGVRPTYRLPHGLSWRPWVNSHSWYSRSYVLSTLHFDNSLCIYLYFWPAKQLVGVKADPKTGSWVKQKAEESWWLGTPCTNIRLQWGGLGNYRHTNTNQTIPKIFFICTPLSIQGAQNILQ